MKICYYPCLSGKSRISSNSGLKFYDCLVSRHLTEPNIFGLFSQTKPKLITTTSMFTAQRITSIVSIRWVNICVEWGLLLNFVSDSFFLYTDTPSEQAILFGPGTYHLMDKFYMCYCIPWQAMIY